jgi:hypothetical protein
MKIFALIIFGIAASSSISELFENNMTTPKWLAKFIIASAMVVAYIWLLNQFLQLK